MQHVLLALEMHKHRYLGQQRVSILCDGRGACVPLYKILIYNVHCSSYMISRSADGHFLHIFRVLNTDNMSIVGVTIDYGPYGFMDKYDPGHICNGSGLCSV